MEQIMQNKIPKLGAKHDKSKVFRAEKMIGMGLPDREIVEKLMSLEGDPCSQPTAYRYLQLAYHGLEEQFKATREKAAMQAEAMIRRSLVRADVKGDARGFDRALGRFMKLKGLERVTVDIIDPSMEAVKRRLSEMLQTQMPGSSNLPPLPDDFDKDDLGEFGEVPIEATTTSNDGKLNEIGELK
jgi:hypothetical protein